MPAKGIVITLDALVRRESAHEIQKAPAVA